MAEYCNLSRTDRDKFLQFARNGRWGTCDDCPRDTDGRVYPEFCPNTDRYDHRMTMEELADYYKVLIKG